MRWVGAVPALSPPGQPVLPGGAARRPALRAARPPPLPDDRARLLPEPRLLQAAARARLPARLRRVRRVAVRRHAGHQLHAQPAGERLQRARLAAGTAGVAHLPALAARVGAVLRTAAAARAGLPSAVRRPLPGGAAEADDAATRSRSAVARLAAALQPRAARRALHVSRHRVAEVDRTHPVQILISRYIHTCSLRARRSHNYFHASCVFEFLHSSLRSVHITYRISSHLTLFHLN